MVTKTINYLVVLFFGGMPLWIGFAINPLWPPIVRRIILAGLIISATIFYIDIYKVMLELEFSDKNAPFLGTIVLLINYFLTILRVYQLWPRVKQ